MPRIFNQINFLEAIYQGKLSGEFQDASSTDTVVGNI